MTIYVGLAVVFIASAAVLVLEILAGRLLAPYVGVTLSTFTGIIGTILAGISLGAWLGGRAADRGDARRLIGPLLIGGAVGALAGIPLVSWLGPSLQGGGAAAIVALAVSGFFLPAALWSTVTPLVAKVLLRSTDETGRVVGLVSAVGTAGALFGTFITGFVLVAELPSRPIVFGTAGVLAAGGLALAGGGSRLIASSLVALGVAGGAAAASPQPCQTETRYYCIRIVPDPAREGGATLWLDDLRHSYVDEDDPTHLEFSYAQTFSDVLSVMASDQVHALHIGAGGFTFPRYLDATRPGSSSVVLEIDPGLVEIGKESLGFEETESVVVEIGDARLTIGELGDAEFDIAIGDAFGGLSVPWHLTTVEFLLEVDRVLKPGGFYVMNLIDRPPIDFARSEAATLSQVWEHVAVLAPPARLQGEVGGNFVLVGSHRPIPVEEILRRNAARGDNETALSGEQIREFSMGTTPLTDDFAPVDQLLGG